ncbi:MAG: hypothetical protein C0622_12090 [Desulfuromonas sp.]|nr:MAG: hypothetical protein C0622_12090 [Desulfuromonas sp.]
MRPATICLFLTLLILHLAVATPGAGMSLTQSSHEYGNVIMRNSNTTTGDGTIIFQHWTHRDKYSCRLCHVDLEFSQYAGDSWITEDDNRDGRFCGACHNGQEAFPIDQCARCHARDPAHLEQMRQENERAFYKFQARLPRADYGNGIDWMKAEELGLIRIKDSLPGITSTRVDSVDNQRNESLKPLSADLPDIIFSHKKHVTWNGCGMCHPEPFQPANGATPISMRRIVSGELCGRCHGTVAFPVRDCTLCHTRPVKMGY